METANAFALSITPAGHLTLIPETDPAAAVGPPAAARIFAAFEHGSSAGILHLAATELQTDLPPGFSYARQFARNYLTELCRRPAPETTAVALTGFAGLPDQTPPAAPPPPLPPPAAEALAALALQAPPMPGAEYITAETLVAWWQDIDAHVRQHAADNPGGMQAWLQEKNPLWRLVGRVTFHLAQNKHDQQRPFAFMATYSHRLSAGGKVQHLPLARALQEYAGENNRAALLNLLKPIQAASEKSEIVRELVESQQIYRASAWTARQAHRFLIDVPAMEQCGIVVRVPDWWKSGRPPRPRVSVRVGETKGRLAMDALLDFQVRVEVDGRALTEAELDEMLAAENGLVRLRGEWVELDRQKLQEALDHWKAAQRAAGDGVSFFEAMRLLNAPALAQQVAVPEETAQTADWSAITAGETLREMLAQLAAPEAKLPEHPPGLRADLRPYQQIGTQWLHFLSSLGLGACLADDMGLGKTIQVLALLLHLRHAEKQGPKRTNLLVVPASLIGNWKAEIARFAPDLTMLVLHPSETPPDQMDAFRKNPEETLAKIDLVVTTYGMLLRLEPLFAVQFNLLILDEAQAIKNPGARQTHAAKKLSAAGRITLTGTPVENRLGDLWSLFDFLNPGLLGSAKRFATFTKRLASGENPNYAPLRALVRPYILRRLKTDRAIISDLPDKTEMKTYCQLTPRQGALYHGCIEQMKDALESADGIQRRGLILAFLMRFKQICNHPAQYAGDNNFSATESGKFQRLAPLCEELSERQEKVLIFTQFREMTQPLADYLETLFSRPGLVLHGGTPVARRRELVEAFQREDGPPFFILSVKAGGTGLNLTAASHVIHFDRWWNPAVENQATDRAFRIGQKKNVFVHKFVCQGTVEEKIDAMISDKMALSSQLLEGGGEKMLTEMSNAELLSLVQLDANKALDV